ncbi:MAG: rhomboid family intramembrane serine protease [Chlorobiaceae bacterium]|nr:rhomboid family intramembrane serine protease [Chlorobiaceae bacterium]NTV59941.1 rhomboid family intramembrane serine protease [Chlorobiaceae bacterium]
MTYSNQPYRPGGFQLMPPAIKLIILGNVAMFFLQVSPAGELINAFGALWPIGSEQSGGLPFMPWQLVSYMFLHGSFQHLFFNMFALWMFGAEIENYWGTRQFLTYYFVCGIGAGIINLLATMGSPYPTVGASGAIYGVLLAFGMMFPDRYIFFYFLVPIKAKYFVAGYALIEFISGIGSKTMGSGNMIAHFAHLGGMLIGFIYILIKRNDFSLSDFIDRIRSGSRRKKGPRPFRQNRVEGPVSETEINAILDKISRDGYSSLTEEERRKLLKAGGK